jgi:Ti-type conjugative transfer relaxase TraA
MAIYHFSAKVISRSAGSSAVASAAYRSASRLHDERLDRCHDFSNKAGVVHSEVMAPDDAPERLGTRESLWNAVEAAELRRDAQLAREIEFAIPREMSQAEGTRLARDFVQREFVDLGMIADLNVHWDIGADGLARPHAHVMLTMREVGEDGFGKKVRHWNRTELVSHWREAWADHVNQRLAELDIDARVDHRSLQTQGLDLEPQNKIGPAAARRGIEGLETERLDDHAQIARRNGDKIIADPDVALDAITRHQATFTRRDLAMFVHRHSDGKDQFDRAMSAVATSPNLVDLGRDGRGDERFTSREMIEVEARLQRASALMAERERHRVREGDRERAVLAARERGLELTSEQRAAFDHVTDRRDLSVVVGYAGTGKSAMLGVARQAWEDAGYEVRGAALSGIAAENLEAGSGIVSRTIASLEHQWGQGRELLSSRDVLVIDEAGMIGSRQMERVLTCAQDAGAKVVLVGDPQQLQAIEAGAAFRALHERHGGVEITDIRRQAEDWQREATLHLATGRTAEALEAYAEHGMVHAAETREVARENLVDRWDRDRLAEPDRSRIILTHTNDEVRRLNLAARGRLRDAGALGEEVEIATGRGERSFAHGDRVMFLRNERGLGVKNGTLGEVEQVSPERMAVRLDDGRAVAFDVKDYAEVDHGYAATIHKAQGMTVDRVHVLATPGLDAQASYVALSRHRQGVELHYGRDDFADADRLARTLSCERVKDMASDYEPARDFAERRGIGERLAERVVEVVRKAPEALRGMFDGLDLGARANPTPAVEPVRDDRTDPERLRGLAIGRHARAVSAIWDEVDQGRPVLAHQRRELRGSREDLRQVDGYAVRDLERAYLDDPSLVKEAAGGRTQRALRSMQLEAEIRTSPALRADRFVETWTRLDREYRSAYAQGDYDGVRSAKTSLGAMARSLERDAQVESLLHGRRIELGVTFEMGRGLAHDLATSVGVAIGRNLGISL